MTDLGERIRLARYALRQASNHLSTGDEDAAKLFTVEAKRCLKPVRCPRSSPKTSNPAQKGVVS